MLTGPVQPAHRCDVCRLVRLYCVCPLSPRLALDTRVVVVMHSREWRRGSNTGHFAQLALTNAEVRLHGLPDRPFDSGGIEPTAPTTLVLFPNRGGRPLTPEL